MSRSRLVSPLLALLAMTAGAQEPVVVVEIFSERPAADATGGADETILVLTFPVAGFEERHAMYVRQLDLADGSLPLAIVGGTRAVRAEDAAGLEAAIAGALESRPAVAVSVRAGRRPESYGLIVEYALDGEVPEGAIVGAALLDDRGVVRAFEYVRAGDEAGGRIELDPPDDLDLRGASAVALVQTPPGMRILGAARTAVEAGGGGKR